jgi:hypothetical protein
MRRTPAILGVALCAALAAPTAASATSTSTPLLTGTVQTVTAEHKDRTGRLTGAEDVRKVLKAGRRTVPLAAGSLPQNEDGDRVTVRLSPTRAGARVVSSSTVAPARTAAGATAATAYPTVREVYVAIVNPAGWAGSSAWEVPGSNTSTAASVTSLVKQASAYWSSQTNGKVQFAVKGVLTAKNAAGDPVPYRSAYACNESYPTADGYDVDGVYWMWQEALDRFEASGVNAFGVGKHLLLVAPNDPYGYNGCPYGLANNIGSLYQNGNAVFVTDSNKSLFSHELGHNLGNNHSNALHCTTQDARGTVTGTYQVAWPTSCTDEGYGDLIDVMGFSGPAFGEGSLNGVHIDRMGLLPTAVKSLSTNGVMRVKLPPLSAAPTSVRTVRMTDSAGQRYYIEYRTASGLDATATKNPLKPSLGVRILRENPSAVNGSYVLDGTPTGPSKLDADGYPVNDYKNAFAAGSVFTSANGSLKVRVDTADASGANVTIARGVALPAPASVSLSVPSRAAAGAATTGTATVKDATGLVVPNWDVTLQVLPKGATSYKNVTTARTNSSGVATFRYTNGMTGTYRAVTVARTSAPARTSATKVTTSVAAPTLNAPATSVAYGTTLRTTGKVTTVVSPVVYLQARLGSGSWGNKVRATVSGTSLAAAYKPTARGTWQLRYYVRADGSGRYAAGYSSARTVVVK